MATMHGQVWAVGGKYRQADMDMCSTAIALNDVERFHVVGGAWHVGPHMANGREDFGLAVHNGEMWAVGGDKVTLSVSSSGSSDEDLWGDEVSSCARFDSASRR